ncbi:DNA alkylation repair protein [Anaerotignum sp.]
MVNPDWAGNFIAKYGNRMHSLSIREASKDI